MTSKAQSLLLEATSVLDKSAQCWRVQARSAPADRAGCPKGQRNKVSRLFLWILEVGYFANRPAFQA